MGTHYRFGSLASFLREFARGRGVTVEELDFEQIQLCLEFDSEDETEKGILVTRRFLAEAEDGHEQEEIVETVVRPVLRPGPRRRPRPMPVEEMRSNRR